MIRIPLKPLSANEIWQGRHVKTKKYRKYSRDALFLLPGSIGLGAPPYSLTIRFGFSSPLADADNPVKGFMDILGKKYGFNDRDIFELHAYKVIVKKGAEFIEFLLESQKKGTLADPLKTMEHK